VESPQHEHSGNTTSRSGLTTVFLQTLCTSYNCWMTWRRNRERYPKQDRLWFIVVQELAGLGVWSLLTWLWLP
jgi:hypothetical protein